MGITIWNCGGNNAPARYPGVATAEAEKSLTSPSGPSSVVERMGLLEGQLLLEVGEDADCDGELRQAIEARVGSKLLADESDEVVDAVLLWFRDGDGDLVDELVDALTFLSETGPIWLMVPKVGTAGHVDPSDIQDAAPTAGLTLAGTFLATQAWTATKLVPRKAGATKAR